MTRGNFDVIVVGGGPGGAASAIKCSQLGYRTLLVEKQPPHRHKPCGGVLPTICIDILDELWVKLSPDMMCTPPTLGLFYIPPSGKVNSGTMRGYMLLNINRDTFDDRLLKAAEDSGVKIMFRAEFKGLHVQDGGVDILVNVDGRDAKFSAEYLIGADGALSRVREKLYSQLHMETLMVLQEWWEAEGEFSEHFYAFFKGEITPTYAYVIPKDGFLVLGAGFRRSSFKQAHTCMQRFRAWLCREFSFNPISLKGSEAASLPYGMPVNGEGCVVLVGDAAGFCNHLSGEGVRLAIESGVLAAESIDMVKHSGGQLSTIYGQRVDGLNKFVQRVHKFATGLTDEKRERFVESEIKRTPLF